MRKFDFTNIYWGHNLEVKTGKDGLVRGFCWTEYVPKVGDLFKWRTNYGIAIGKVVDSRWTVNVDDMYEVTLEVVERKENK